MSYPDLGDQPCQISYCPISKVLEVIEGKWSILILRELFQGDRRTGEFLKALPGLSTKTLTQRLRNLEQHGLVVRQVYGEVPPRVEYRLSDRGRELQPILRAMYQVGQRWMAQGPDCTRSDCNCPIETQAQGAIESFRLP
ncbi:MAG: helix-turn-helix transcriptional regulator [Synechococcales cyanobacterium RM1_1_8]|nr:helix-turn-helix transcriptional regulator [Synechococcales cyanobacterium RM1_1_8]